LNVGLLPASGRASRIHGIPKFALPISNNLSLLEWHVRELEERADIVRISTRESWLPILETMELRSAQVFVKEPSTMSDAINSMVLDISDRHVVGMPDTFIAFTDRNFYSELFNSSNSGALALFNCPTMLRGKVGQVLSDDKGQIVDVQDKNEGCDYKFMWGAFMFSSSILNPIYGSPSFDFKEWAAEGKDFRGLTFSGEYVDAGSFEGILDMYRLLNNG